ncbi:MAG: bifunctional indole-3-glycerol-phosphate synthase TrpC/phosphoribosylanthranilate isomerase TrpF [Candidatus Marinimicrobia bacterium]|nr:bifunctional indole-3-glycerol-phosphate synthase TrpC/phosphoribosylanthranilate isomerase TrpF [Candidatus Neomarinimicrobiota bacterium]
MILDEIVANTKQEIVEQKKRLPLDSMLNQLKPSQKNFKAALVEGRGINLIAEVKRKSPSRGDINQGLNIDEIIDIYDQNPNVNAISFLTDQKYFGGSLEELSKIHSQTDKPILRKDFIIDEYQVYQARYYKADAILLIARILSQERMGKFVNIAHKYNMDCLVEVHNEQDITKIPENAKIIGINNRNLDTLEISLDSTKKLSQKLKDKAEVIVTESGILTSSDVKSLKHYADAMLIGSAIMASDSPSLKIDSLFQPKIKICGITNLDDALLVAGYAADFMGFIFYEKSPRYITPNKAQRIIKQIKNEHSQVKIVGVFVNSKLNRLKEIQKECRLDYLQLHGDETPEYVERLEGEVIKAFQVSKDESVLSEIQRYKTDLILLDTFHPQHYGGTGEAFDWELLNKLKNKKIFLAGGINPDNYSRAISYQPYAVDINSGVEKKPGKKDEKLVQNILKRR